MAAVELQHSREWLCGIPLPAITMRKDDYKIDGVIIGIAIFSALWVLFVVAIRKGWI